MTKLIDAGFDTGPAFSFVGDDLKAIWDSLPAPLHGGTHPHLAHDHDYQTAVIHMDPTAMLSRVGTGQIWEVRSYDGEVYGIGGPQPERAWEAAAHYLGVEGE